MNDPTPPDLTVVRQRLSPERFAPYERDARGSLSEAFRLYEWNTRVSGALYESLQALEVVLRNALHSCATEAHEKRGHGGNWFDRPHSPLDVKAQLEVETARRRLHQWGRPATPGRIVAELPFGFWRYLLARRYHERLWVPALHHAFEHLRPARRQRAVEPLSRLYKLRLRIVHSEPVHHRRHDRDWADLLFLARAICPHSAAWIEQTSRVPEVLAARP